MRGPEGSKVVDAGGDENCLLQYDGPFAWVCFKSCRQVSKLETKMERIIRRRTEENRDRACYGLPMNEKDCLLSKELSSRPGSRPQKRLRDSGLERFRMVGFIHEEGNHTEDKVFVKRRRTTMVKTAAFRLPGLLVLHHLATVAISSNHNKITGVYLNIVLTPNLLPIQDAQDSGCQVGLEE